METKIMLPEAEIPTHRYNVVAGMPHPPATPLGTDGNPIGPDALAAIFTEALIGQEVSSERWIPYPGSVRDVYRLFAGELVDYEYPDEAIAASLERLPVVGWSTTSPA